MRNLVIIVSLTLFSDACIDRLSIADADIRNQVLVVDGQITDRPGPYEVRLFTASASEAILNNAKPVLARNVMILDDAGKSEVLQSEGGGVYKTSQNGIRGEIGKKYSLRIELPDGTTFESTQDEIRPVGEIDSVYYEWQSVLPLNGPTQYGFKMFLDAKNGTENGYLRWRFSGTYVIESFPHLRRFNDGNCLINKPPPDPPPCSGYVYNFLPGGPGLPAQGNLEYVSECTCCICWVTDYESKPHLNEDVLITDGRQKRVEIGYVPFNEWTFGKGRYMVKVDQMSLSKEAFEFWKIFKDQKNGSTSLFQPALGKAKTNIYSTNSDREAIGIFYASSINTKVIFLGPDDAKAKVPPYEIQPPIDNCALWRSCAVIFANSSTSPPKEWE